MVRPGHTCQTHTIKFFLLLSLLVVTCCLLIFITFANDMGLDQDRQNIGPDLDPNCLTP